MSRLLLLVPLLVVGCSRSETRQGGADAGPSPGAIVEVAPPPATSTPPPFGALEICNRMAASGAVSHCRPSDAGMSQADFKIGVAGAGVVAVAQDQAHYRKILGGMSFEKFRLATSEFALAIVFWQGGGEVEAAEIRLALEELRH